jgi:hypothetical protein
MDGADRRPGEGASSGAARQLFFLAVELFLAAGFFFAPVVAFTALQTFLATVLAAFLTALTALPTVDVLLPLFLLLLFFEVAMYGPLQEGNGIAAGAEGN